MTAKASSERILELLQKEPGVGIPVTDIAKTLKMDARKVSTSISNCMRRNKTDSEWAKVRRTSRGFYGYMPNAEPIQPATKPDPWVEIGQAGNFFILKSPDGTLYGAQVLREFLNA